MRKIASTIFLFGITLALWSVNNDRAVRAASGGLGASGEIFYVEGVEGVVGWAQGAEDEVIEVDLYISKRGDGSNRSLCTKGGIRADKTLPDTTGRFGNKNGKLFQYQDSCLKNLSDGEYDAHLALGPNLFAPGPFQFSLRTIDQAKGTRIWLHYLGSVIARGSNIYESYPTIMKEGQTYKMWFAGDGPNTPGDHIFYATSTNGINWNVINGPLKVGAVLVPTQNNCVCADGGSGGSCPAGESFSMDDMHTADPSVVKVGNTYYLYYTGASKKFSCFGTDGHIFLASSSDGVHWQKNTDSFGKPKPVLSPHVECSTAANCGPWFSGYSSWYGAGQSSVLYQDITGDGTAEFIHFFSDFTNNTYALSSALSSDGINFTRWEDGLMGEATWDMKYSQYLGKYLALNAFPSDPVDQPGSPGNLVLSLSSTGRKGSWATIGPGANQWGTKILVTMDKLTADSNHWAVHNAGLVGNPQGIIEGRNTVVYFGAGVAMQPYHPTWDIAAVDLWFSQDSLPGDLNADGKVDILDLRQLILNFTNIFDYNLVVGNFGK